jgi:hypothetical protein
MARSSTSGQGRPKGAKNRKTVEQSEAVAKSGVTPLQYMLRVMRNGKAEATRRDDMAKAAAPYVHPKLGQVDIAHGTKDGKPFEIVVHSADEKL